MKDRRLNKEFLEEFKPYDFSKIIENKIFLVGSITKAKEEFIKIESILQILYNKRVSICSVDGLLNKNMFSKEEWTILQDIALEKLKDHNAILVLDVENYIGNETREEIEYARDILNKPIYYLSELKKEN
ncbi:MAG: hypothetical protein EU541_04375 [Promethearchaeota archaeon]|nr:MAG: hypothetical protein EU541_04375 [Candidatus Lokiarchaeota archaeon]